MASEACDYNVPSFLWYHKLEVIMLSYKDVHRIYAFEFGKILSDPFHFLPEETQRLLAFELIAETE